MDGVLVGDLMPEIDTFLNKSSNGDTVAIKSEFGWHAIQIVRINKKVAESYENKLEELKTQHKDSMESIEVAKIMDDLDGLLYDSGLDAVSKDTGIEKKIISITKTSEYAQANDSMIWESSKVGENNRIIVDKKDVFWEIVGVNEPREKTVDEVRSEIIIELKGMNKINKMNDIAVKIQQEGYDGLWTAVDIPREFGGSEAGLSKEVFSKDLSDSGSVHIFSRPDSVIIYKINGVGKLDKPVWDEQAISRIINEEQISISLDRLKDKYNIEDQTK
jgi:hypothetical protein